MSAVELKSIPDRQRDALVHGGQPWLLDGSYLAGRRGQALRPSYAKRTVDRLWRYGSHSFCTHPSDCCHRNGLYEEVRLPRRPCSACSAAAARGTTWGAEERGIYFGTVESRLPRALGKDGRTRQLYPRQAEAGRY